MMMRMNFTSILSKHKRIIACSGKKLTSVAKPSFALHDSRCGARLYHTYPDPSDKGSITTALASKSNIEKQILDKSGDAFTLDSKFKLEEMFPGVPSGKKVEDSGNAPPTLNTKLDSGLTVVTQDMPGLMTSFAIMVGTGSSYEIQQGDDRKHNTGVTQMLELTAFKNTSTREHHDILTEIEKLGGMIQCIAGRENILYCVDVLRENVEPALDILADTILNPKFTQDEIEESKMVARMLIDEMPSDMLSRDAAQMAGYGSTPLGNAHFCPDEDIDNITAESVRSFHQEFFVGSNCYVAAAGVDNHDAFVALVEKKFKNIKNTSDSRNEIKLRREHSKYTGGMVKNERNLKEPFVKIAVGFEVGGWNDEHIIATCVLNQLLGGGSSFSAGGPGKGMYTRLYREILNQYHWAESAEAFVLLHDELGMLGIDGSCPPEYVPHLLKVILDQLVKLAIQPIGEEELNRAKNMCKSMMLMQLESRIVLCEDLARQFVTYEERKLPDDICKQIDDVTAQDLMDVADRMISYPPSIGCVGDDLSKVPNYEDIKSFTSNFVEEVRKIKSKSA